MVPRLFCIKISAEWSLDMILMIRKLEFKDEIRRQKEENEFVSIFTFMVGPP